MTGVEKGKLFIPDVQLQRYFFTRTFCMATEGYKKEKGQEMALDVSCSLMKNSEDQTRWKVSLIVKLSPRTDKIQVPYDFDLKVEGFFICPGLDKLEEKVLSSIVPLIYVNAASVLFATAREYLRSITSAGPYGPFLLPGHHFRPTDLKDGSAKGSSTFFKGMGSKGKLLN